jgi:hypothetical protein
VGRLTCGIGGRSAAPGFHDRIDDTFVNPDFCGSGVAVRVRDVHVANGRETEAGVAVAFSQKLTFTYGDRSITSRNVEREVIEIVEGRATGGQDRPPGAAQGARWRA